MLRLVNIVKDYTAAGNTVHALRGVSVNFRKPDMRELGVVRLEEMKRYLAEGHFPPGSMGPKVEAAIEFVENSGGRAIITCLEKAVDALEGKTGTTLIP